MITIEKEVTLAQYTSFRIGGPAELFTTVSTPQQLRHAVSFAHKRGIPYYILGGGTNVLVSDSGFRGLVIRAKLEAIRLGEDEVEAQAGVELMHLVECLAQQGLSGLERLAGIPGTLGGAVRGNAGAYGTSIAETVRQVLALDTDAMELVSVPGEGCDFGYRTSTFKKGQRLVVVSALLELRRAPRQEIEEKVRETLAKRYARNLQAERSVGSFFMNPTVSDAHLVHAFESERQVRCRDNRIPAGWFIDKAGLRNRRVGGAMVSDQHANYLINTGSASARDVLELAGAIKDEVAAKTGVRLQEEVQYLGW